MATPSATMRALGRIRGEFQVQDETNSICTARWQFTPSIPVYRHSGVSGWALLDGVVKRLHVCAYDPCIAKHPGSKYGNLPPPNHVRLLEQGAAGVASSASGSGVPSSPASLAPSPPAAAPQTLAVAGPELAVAGPEAAAAAGADAVPESPELSPAVAGPEAPPGPPPLPSPSSPPSPPALLPPAVAEPVAEIAASKLLDKSLVATPPPPLPKFSGTLPEVVPPRAGRVVTIAKRGALSASGGVISAFEGHSETTRGGDCRRSWR